MGFIYLFIYFSSWLCCPLRFQNSPQTCWWEDFLVFGNLSSFRTPAWVGSPSLTLLSLFLSFIFCPTSFRRQQVAFLGAWCPLPVFRSRFVEFSQCSNVLSMNLWGRKWSPRLFLCQLRTAPPSFRISNSSTGIPSPPLALFVVMLPKAHLTLYSRMSDSRWVITP